MKSVAISLFFRFSGFDMSTGNDLASIQNTNREECEEICSKDTRCIAYVINEVNKNCWLKDNLDGFRKINIEVKNGIKVQPWEKMLLYNK